MAQLSTTPPPLTFTVSPVLQDTLYNGPVPSYLSANPSVTNPLASAIVFYHPPSSPGGKGGREEKEEGKQQQQPPRLLLVQRAPTDTLPLKWEVPGGSVDIGLDVSLIYGAVRELWEETGLVARRVVRDLDVYHEFYEETADGRKLTWRMVIFEIEVGFTSLGQEEECMAQRKIEARGSYLGGNEQETAVTVVGGGEAEYADEEEQGGVVGPFVKLDPAEHVRYLWATEEDIRSGRCGNVELELTNEAWRGFMLRAFDLHGSGGTLKDN